jgi:hypothetical protein
MEDTPKVPKTLEEKENKKRLIVVLEGATLETVKQGDNYALLNCDDHAPLLKKRKRDTADARPDITHQVFLDTGVSSRPFMTRQRQEINQNLWKFFKPAFTFGFSILH